MCTLNSWSLIAWRVLRASVVDKLVSPCNSYMEVLMADVVVFGYWAFKRAIKVK